jgi:hypothetical protein
LRPHPNTRCWWQGSRLYWRAHRAEEDRPLDVDVFDNGLDYEIDIGHATHACVGSEQAETSLRLVSRQAAVADGRRGVPSRTAIDLVTPGNAACHRGGDLLREPSSFSLAAANVLSTADTVQPIRRAISRVENPVAFHTQITRSSADSDSRRLCRLSWPVSGTSPVEGPSVEVFLVRVLGCCPSAPGAEPTCIRRVTNRSRRFQRIGTYPALQESAPLAE